MQITFKDGRIDCWSVDGQLDGGITVEPPADFDDFFFHFDGYKVENGKLVADTDRYEQIIVGNARIALLEKMSTACNAAIVAGVDVGADHYSLTLEDQLNMLSLAAAAQAGQSVPYHADGQECRMYAPEEFQSVVAAATAWKTYQESYYNSLKQYILTMDGEALDQVVYGMPIPPEHQTAVLRTLLAQMEVQP